MRFKIETTDNPKEVFDLVDVDDHIIGRATRKACHSDANLIHRAIFVLIFNRRNQMLWQKRSLTKNIDPGHWVTSVSGHVDSGENYFAAAMREMKEELKIELDLAFLGKYLFRYAHESEYSAVFRAVDDGPFYFNKTEIAEVKFMTIDEALQKEKQSRLQLSQAAYKIIKALNLC